MRIRFELSKNEWIYPLVILILGFSYYISYFNYGIGIGDEGFLVYGAVKVLQGCLPMSDFISYPPGSYFLLGLLFKLFGVNLLVSRLLEMAFLLINGLMMFYIGKRLMPKSWACFPSLLLITFPGPWYKVFFIFGLLLPLITLLRYLESRTTMRILIVGWATGLALIFKFESGFYSLVMIGVILLFNSIWREGRFSLDKKAILFLLKEALLCSVGLLSVIAPFIIYYYSKSALTKLVYSLRMDSSFANVSEVSEPYGKPSIVRAVTKFHLGSLTDHFFWLIFLLYLYGFVKILLHVFIEKRREFPFLLPVLIMGVLSLSYPYLIPYKSYILSSGSMAYILFGFLIYSSARKRNGRSVVVLVVLILLFWLYVLDTFNMRNYFESGSIARLYGIKKEGVRPISSNRAKIYVGRGQSNAINGLIQFFEGKNAYLMPLHYEPMVNFLTGLENPTRFTILNAFFLKDESNQNKVIDEMEKYEIQYLMINRFLWISQNKDLVGFNEYAPVLYEFVLRRYELEKDFKGYLIFSRRPLSR